MSKYREHKEYSKGLDMEERIIYALGKRTPGYVRVADSETNKTKDIDVYVGSHSVSIKYCPTALRTGNLLFELEVFHRQEHVEYGIPLQTYRHYKYKADNSPIQHTGYWRPAWFHRGQADYYLFYLSKDKQLWVDRSALKDWLYDGIDVKVNGVTGDLEYPDPEQYSRFSKIVGLSNKVHEEQLRIGHPHIAIRGGLLPLSDLTEEALPDIVRYDKLEIPEG